MNITVIATVSRITLANHWLWVTVEIMVLILQEENEWLVVNWTGTMIDDARPVDLHRAAFITNAQSTETLTVKHLSRFLKSSLLHRGRVLLILLRLHFRASNLSATKTSVNIIKKWQITEMGTLSLCTKCFMCMRILQKVSQIILATVLQHKLCTEGNVSSLHHGERSRSHFSTPGPREQACTTVLII